jgi:antitoxin (DNA-binding transcriptional repressor) of toxin-antitoxin stability system
MRTVSMSVTEASRNFADCINRARYQGTTFVLHKNGVTVARIVPVERKQKIALELDEAREPGNAVEKEAGNAASGSVREIW